MLRLLVPVLLSAGLCVAQTASESMPVLRKGPPLTFHVPDGGQKSLSDFHGKVIAIEFIQTTCPHCQAASHNMTKLQHELGPRGFQAIDLAINTTSDADITAFMHAQQTDFLVGWTGIAEMGHFLNLSPGVRFLVPQLALIDRHSDIRYQTPPQSAEITADENLLRQALLTLLNDKGR